MGYSPKEMLDIFKEYCGSIKYFEILNILKLLICRLFNNKVRVDGLNSGKVIEKKVRGVAAKKGIYNMSDISIPLFIPSVDLNTLYQNTTTNDSNEPGDGVTYMGYDVLGYIEIPATDVEYPIIPDYQSSINALNVGIVVLYPSNIGLNEPGNTVLAGHNYRDGSFFSNNKRLQEGDEIYITDTSGERVEYEIYKKYETSTSDSSYMNRDTEGRREISLTTCTDDTSGRLIIWAKEV